jgi:hypothetical protein
MAKRKTNAVKGVTKGGRNKAFCKIYRARFTKTINKKARLARHIRNFPADLQAKEVAVSL